MSRRDVMVGERDGELRPQCGEVTGEIGDADMARR